MLSHATAGKSDQLVVPTCVLYGSEATMEGVLQGGTQRWMTLLTDRREHSVTTPEEKIIKGYTVIKH